MSEADKINQDSLDFLSWVVMQMLMELDDRRLVESDLLMQFVEQNNKYVDDLRAILASKDKV